MQGHENKIAGKHTDDSAGGCQDHQRGQHGHTLLVHCCGGIGAGLSLKHYPDNLGKTGQGKAADNCQADNGENAHDESGLVQGYSTETAQVDKEFTDEPVEGRQTGNGQRPDQEGSPGNAHVFDQSAQGVDGTCPGFFDDYPGTHEQERFEDCVIEHMQQASGKPEDRHDWLIDRNADHTDAYTDEDNADVFNTVIGQQALQVVLSQGIDDPQYPGYHPGEDDDFANQQGM